MSNKDLINKVFNEDCLEGMKRIEDKSIQLILCDLPYGITANKWDSLIPFKPLWEQYERILKDDGVIVLTAAQPFTSLLVVSNLKLFRYSWVWEKSSGSGFMNAKKQPLRRHEDILVFYKKQPKYNPQGLIEVNKVIKEREKFTDKSAYGKIGIKGGATYTQKYTNYPISILKFKNEKRTIHNTQKPLELFEYLIRTYTDENDLVLDNCMGSGTTAIACLNTKRDYIGFELDKDYFELLSKRISEWENDSL